MFQVITLCAVAGVALGESQHLLTRHTDPAAHIKAKATFPDVSAKFRSQAAFHHTVGKDVAKKSAASLEAEKALSYSDENTFFEITYSTNENCYSNFINGYGVVYGFEVGRCEDYLYNEGKDDYGVAESQMLREPNNDGFPIISWFKGHGCKGSPEGSWRLEKKDFNFPQSYRPGPCIPWFEGYYRQAKWSNKKHVPQGPGVVAVGSDTKQRACSNKKHFFYSFEYYEDCRTFWSSDDDLNCVVDLDIDTTDDYVILEYEAVHCVGSVLDDDDVPVSAPTPKPTPKPTPLPVADPTPQPTPKPTPSPVAGPVACVSSDTCPSMQNCVAGSCSSGGTGSQCTLDAHCSSGNCNVDDDGLSCYDVCVVGICE